MKKTIKIGVLWILILSIFMLVGCGEKKDNHISQEPTSYVVLDAEGNLVKYLTEDHPEVVKINEMVEAYAKAFFDKSYQNFNMYAEYPYYTESILEVLRERNMGETYRNEFMTHRIIRNFDRVRINILEFNESLDRCKMKGNVYTTIASANEAWLNEQGIKANTPYVQDYELPLVKDGDQWKTNGFSTSVMIEVQ